jgi:hypothetical protein
MKGGRGPRRKGDRVEREVLALLREAGLEARRVPLSGSAPGYPGDLEVELPGLGRVLVEVKARKRVALEAWLEGRGLLVLKADRRPPLAVMPLQALLALIRAGDGEGAAPGPPPHPRSRNGLYNPPCFPENEGAKRLQPPPLQPAHNRNRPLFPWATATGNPRPGRGFWPAQPPLYRPLNRYTTPPTG